MKGMTLARAADMLGVPLYGPDAPVGGVSTDTRRMTPDALFFALRGDRFDAHQVLDRESDLPLAGVVVERPVKHPAPQLLVEDSRRALGRLAAAWRRTFAGTVIGLTGSNGKTTVKQMLAAILETEGPTLATQGNLNNDIGMPLTLLRLAAEHRYAVIEMGANHFGEIAYLAGLARPDVALVTNAGAAHLEGFGDVAGVARAKGELFEALAAGAVAVINADDPWADYWRGLVADHRLLSFGQAAGADVRVIDVERPRLAIAGREVALSLPLPGRHNVMNAAAAAAVAWALEIAPERIAEGLARTEPVAGRLTHLQGIGGAMLIDDSYNANPDSVGAAIEFLANRPGVRYLVLGDLAELGPSAAEALGRLGEQARASGIDALLTMGDLARHASKAFGSGGVHFDSVEALVNALEPHLGLGVTVLVKGSRSAGMERVVEALQDDGSNNGGEVRHAV